MRFLPVLAMIVIGCNASEVSQVHELRSGALVYRATTLSGEALLTGSLDLRFDDSLITGTWSIAWAPGADTTIEVGPQVGSGTLVGRRRGNSLMIDLNPGWADNNAVLLGELIPQGVSGRWQWNTIAGPATEGRFTASP
jgi:hypothetical protein